MEQYIFLAEENGSGDKGESTSGGSINFDKSKVFNNVDTSNKDKANDASLQNAFNTAFIWAGIICVIVIVVAGLTFVTSSGNPGRISKAKSAIVCIFRNWDNCLSSFDCKSNYRWAIERKYLDEKDYSIKQYLICVHDAVKCICSNPIRCL